LQGCRRRLVHGAGHRRAKRLPARTRACERIAAAISASACAANRGGDDSDTAQHTHTHAATTPPRRQRRGASRDEHPSHHSAARVHGLVRRVPGTRQRNHHPHCRVRPPPPPPPSRATPRRRRRGQPVRSQPSAVAQPPQRTNTQSRRCRSRWRSAAGRKLAARARESWGFMSEPSARNTGDSAGLVRCASSAMLPRARRWPPRRDGCCVVALTDAQSPSLCIAARRHRARRRLGAPPRRSQHIRVRRFPASAAGGRLRVSDAQASRAAKPTRRACRGGGGSRKHTLQVRPSSARPPTAPRARAAVSGADGSERLTAPC